MTATQTFTHAIAVGGDAVHLATACAKQLDGATGTLGFVYLTENLAPDAGRLVDELKARTGIDQWVGAVGYGICATGVEYYDEPACAALICDIGVEKFKLFDAIGRGGVLQPDATRSWLDSQDQSFAVVHADPRAAAMTGRLSDFSAARDIFIVGGVTADTQAPAQISGGPVAGSISGVVFDPDVRIATNLTQGCSPIGRVHDVTLGDEDILMELDGEPALEILARDLGEDFAGDWNSIGGLIHAGLPIKGSDTGDYLVRALVGIDPKRGWLQIGEMIEPGAKLHFVRRDATTALADLEKMLDRIASHAGGPPKAGLYHNCIARGRSQFGPGSEELATIRSKLGDFPLVGMFGNGEISHGRLYSYTGVLTLFL
jgi:small ligand-binding sensory domain FIST